MRYYYSPSTDQYAVIDSISKDDVVTAWVYDSKQAMFNQTNATKHSEHYDKFIEKFKCMIEVR